jgi:hypothetical protein
MVFRDFSEWIKLQGGLPGTSKMIRRTIWAGLAAVFFVTPVMAKSADLQDAFKAAFGQAPPMIRHANLPKIGEKDLRLEPVLLIHVSGRRFALIVSENFDGGYWAPGDVAVAYLDHDSAGWKPVRVWYEFDRNGSFGQPFSGQSLLSFNFGGAPFFAGEGGLCGMGGCQSWYDFIGFYSDGPMIWGGMASSAWYDPSYMHTNQDPLPDSDGLTGCGGYEYSSVISAPRNKGDVMRVTYTGWMMPGGKGQKRHDFHFSTALSQSHGELKLQPATTLPNCGD